MDYLAYQYELTRGSRAVLLRYCDTLKPVDFVTELPTFGHGSMRNLLVHVVTTYQFWLGNFGLRRGLPYLKTDAVQTAADARRAFTDVDQLVADFYRPRRHGSRSPFPVRRQTPQRELLRRR